MERNKRIMMDINSTIWAYANERLQVNLYFLAGIVRYNYAKQYFL